MICIDNISVRAGSFTLSSISFEIEKGECLALMGKSGSGKTTVMEAICGLRDQRVYQYRWRRAHLRSSAG
jgi:ABC-type dipeptide/oligopeptide/nickel transport system ATPase subunit